MVSGRTHAVFRAALAALALGFALPASAGTVQDAAAAYGRGDYVAMLARIRETKSADWVALQAFVTRLGDNLYGEIGYRHLATIRPDPAQPVLGPPPPAPTAFGLNIPPSLEGPFRAKADASCSVALSRQLDRDDIRLWSMPDGAPIVTIPLSAGVGSIAISQRHLAIERSQTVDLYDVRTGVFVRAIEKVAYGKVQTAGLYFSHDGKQLVIVPEWGPIIRAPEGRLFELESGIELPAQSVVLPPWSQFGVVASDCPLVKQRTFSQ